MKLLNTKSNIPLLKLSLCSVALSLMLSTSGCSMFSVYKIDLPQGTPITLQQAQRVQLGMTKSQVLYVMGSPALRDTLAPNRWDYIYDYTPGTYGKREGKKTIKNNSQHFIVYFNEANIVTKLEGINTLPTAKP